MIPEIAHDFKLGYCSNKILFCYAAIIMESVTNNFIIIS